MKNKQVKVKVEAEQRKDRSRLRFRLRKAFSLTSASVLTFFPKPQPVFYGRFFMAYFLSVVGLVLVIEGLPYFAFPARVKEWALTLQEIPERPLRVMGLVSMLAGLLLVYISRRVF